MPIARNKLLAFALFAGGFGTVVMSRFLIASTLEGQTLLVGFGLILAALVMYGFAESPGRRVRVALVVAVGVIAIDFSVVYLWPNRTPLFSMIASCAILFSTAWYLVEVRRSQRSPGVSI